MFEPIETSKIYMRVIDQILTLVRDGTLKPGDQLPPETQLAEQLGVSRSSVREALRALEILGVIESKTGVGSFVKGLPSTNMLSSSLHDLVEEGSPLEIIEARKTIEPEIASLAALRREAQDLQALKKSLKQMEQRVVRGKSTMEVDIEFHLLLAAACRNPVLADCMRLLADRMGKRFWHDMKEESLSVGGRSETYLRHHREIFAAVEQGRSQKAEAAMLRHLEAVEAGL
jgi:GntR family transcriptional repressor for pyruvate dehydrogenase complex